MGPFLILFAASHGDQEWIWKIIWPKGASNMQAIANAGSLLLIFFLLFSSTCEAAISYSQAHAVVERQTNSIEVRPDGTYRELEEVYIRVQDLKAKMALQVQRFQVNRHYSRLRIELFELLKADGSRVPVDLERHMKEEDSAKMASMNIYDPAQRVIKVFVPDLSPGDTIHYRARYENFKPMIPGQFFGKIIIQGHYPVRSMDIEIRVPEGMDLHHLIKNDLSAPPRPRDGSMPLTSATAEPSQKGAETLLSFSTRAEPFGARTFLWHIEHVPELVPEPYMPSVSRVAMRLLFSTLDDWSQVGRWYYGLTEPKIVIDQEIRKKVSELVEGKDDPMDRIRALFFFVARKIRYMGIIEEANRPGFEPHDIRLTFRRRYGVCRDKAALLVGMLRAANFKAAPVIISAGSKLDPEVAVPYFNHAIAAVLDLGDRPIFLDPTDETTLQLLPDYEQDSSCIIADREGSDLILTPVNPPEGNLFHMVLRERLSNSGLLSGTFQVKTSGFVDTVFRSILMNLSRFEQEQFLRRFILSRRPDVVIDDIYWDNLASRQEHFTFGGSFRLSQAICWIDGAQGLLFPVGAVSSDGILEEYVIGRKVSMSSRHYSLKLGYSFLTVLEEYIQGPEGLVLEPGQSILLSNDLYEYMVSWRKEGTGLVRKRVLKVKRIEVEPCRYPALKRLAAIMDANGFRPVIARSEPFGYGESERDEQR
jgi:hypothetical protein